MNYEVLDVNIEFYRQDLKVFLPIVFGLIGFIIFWFTQKSEKVKEKFMDRYGPEPGAARFILFSRYLGAATMGLLPLLGFFLVFPDSSLTQLGLGWYRQTTLATILWSLGLCAIVIPLASFSARKPKNLLNYPQIRTKVWDNQLVWANLLSWAVYLLGYELLFRGVMLFPLVEEIGLWPAIGVNIGMYSATHIPKGLDEAIGAIPLAIVLCLLSVLTGTIWIALLVHVAMSWSNTLTALKFNPDMKIVK